MRQTLPKTATARCLSPFFTVLPMVRGEKGTGTVGKRSDCCKTGISTEPVPIFAISVFTV